VAFLYRPHFDVSTRIIMGLLSLYQPVKKPLLVVEWMVADGEFALSGNEPQ
jgi:hypothetical protein